MASNDSEAHALLSRSTGLPSYLGKATAELGTKVPDVVADDFKRICAARGTTVSEVLRDFVMVQAYGYQEVQRLRETQLRMVAGIDPESLPMPLPTSAAR